MYGLGSKRSTIRELFEFGKKFAKEVGEENVFDFSLGNPSVPAPKKVKETLIDLINNLNDTALHGYTSAQGDINTRNAIANNIKSRFNVDITADDIYVTCGAAASLSISLRALANKDDQFILLAPYFPEYNVFVKSAGGTPVTVPFTEPDFQIDFDKFEKALNKNTKAVIVNSPNNPCGVVYSEQTIIKLCQIIKNANQKFGTTIFLIADEPYREIVYDNITVPYLMNYYDNTIVCYSYSKSLSLPGERIGYIALNPKMQNQREIYFAICGAGRALGYVCAPSTFQKVVEKCVNELPDVDAYKKNRDLLYNNLTNMGYNCVHPDGAFYLFVKAPNGNSEEFSERAKHYGLLIVPADAFEAKGYVRLAYCVSYDMINRSLPKFKQLIDSYKE